jgi:nucleoid DNA-binding protein
MTKKDLIEHMALEMGVSKKAAEMAVEAFIKIVQGQMRHPGREVVMRGFGTFKAKLVPARTGRNPQTGAPVEIPEHIKVIFKPSKVRYNFAV